jgi:hypothetical protein
MHHASKSKKKAGCGCSSKPKSHRPKRKMNSALAWMVKKNKELREKHPGKPFGWYGKEAGRLYREAHKK